MYLIYFPFILCKKPHNKAKAAPFAKLWIVCDFRLSVNNDCPSLNATKNRVKCVLQANIDHNYPLSEGSNTVMTITSSNGNPAL